MPTCEHCGDDDFGNAGALAVHERSCDENPVNQDQGGVNHRQRAVNDVHGSGGDGPGYQTHPPRNGQATAPANAQSGPPAARTQENAGPPAKRQQHDQQAIQNGAEFGEMLAGAASGDPEQQAEAKGQLLQAVGAGVARFGQEVAEREKADARRAKEASQHGTLQRAEEFLDCPQCGRAVTHIPEAGGTFPCEHCGEPLELVTDAEVEG